MAKIQGARTILIGDSSEVKPTSGVEAESLFFEADTERACEFYGTSWPVTKIKGADLVNTRTGTGEVGKNRNINLAATTMPATDTTNHALFTVLEDVKSVKVDGGVNGTFVLFDAIDATSAKALMEATGGAGVTVQYDFIPPAKSETYISMSYFRRVDVLPLTVAERKVIGAQ